MKKYKILIITLTLGLLISLYLNFKPDPPLYKFNVCIPFETGGGHEVRKVIDSNKDREDYLYLANILEGYHLTVADKESLPKVPDLILIRDIPSQGVFSGVYSIYFDEEISYVIIGMEYEGQEIYQFDDKSTKRIIWSTGFSKEEQGV